MLTKINFCIILLFLFLLFSCSKQSNKKIPIISKKFLKKENLDTIKSMIFYNHFNKRHTINSLSNKVSVVNFFFTSCNTICPVMENNLKGIVKQNQDVHFISYTIDPERDSISVLKNHYEKIANKATNWFFVNGKKKDLKKIAEFYLSSIKNKEDETFYHTSTMVLLDKKMRIRGFYDALNAEEIKLLKEDILLLLKE